MTAIIVSLGFQVIPHPPYSLDLAHVTSSCFLSLKNISRVKNNSYEKVITKVIQWFNVQAKELYLNGISQLINSSQKCIGIEGLEGSNVEK